MCAHVRKNVPAAVSNMIIDCNHDAENSWQTLSVENIKEHVQLGPSMMNFPDVLEGVGNADGDDIHPQKETDKGVVSKIGEGKAGSCVDEVFIRNLKNMKNAI